MKSIWESKVEEDAEEIRETNELNIAGWENFVIKYSVLRNIPKEGWNIIGPLWKLNYFQSKIQLTNIMYFQKSWLNGNIFMLFYVSIKMRKNKEMTEEVEGI